MLRMCDVTYHVIISEICDPHCSSDPDELYAICDDEESAKALAAKWNEEHSDAWAKAWVEEVIKLLDKNEN